MTFIFVDEPVMEGVAASTTGLAADTGALAQRIQAAGAAAYQAADEVGAARLML